MAGCGGGAQTSTTCTSPKQVRALAQLRTDVAALRRAAAHPGPDTLHGNAAVNHATDRFLLDVATAPVDPLVRNRMIDHAAAALLGACEQCFQALEAQRPIPAIAHAHQGEACRAK